MGQASRSLLLTCLLTAAACEPPPAPPQPAIDAAAMNALLQRLDRLVAALEGAPRPTALASPPQDSPPERTIVAGDANDLRSRIEALESTLAAMQRSLPQSGAAVMPAVGNAPATRTQGVQQLRELIDRDEKQETNEALRSLFMLGPGQVLDRLGTPAEVYIANNSTRFNWTYRSGETSLTVYFSNGVVMGVD